MNMKAMTLTGILMLTMFMIVVSHAMGEVIYLNNSNKFSSGEFNVTAELDGTENQISVYLTEWPDYIIPMGFEKFSYNLNIGVNMVSENNPAWKKNIESPNADGFGNFLSNKITAECNGYCHPRIENYGYGINNPLVFILKEDFNVSDLIENEQGSSLAVHLIYKDTNGNCTFCTWISDGRTNCHHTLSHVVNAGEERMIDIGEYLTINLNFKDGFIKGTHTAGGCSEDGHSGGDCMGDHSGERDLGDSDTGSCPTGEHTEGSCPGGLLRGSGGSVGPKGITHGQCEPHNHHVTIDWGDETSAETTNSSVNQLEFNHTYSNNGTYLVNVAVEDQYGRMGKDLVKVTVMDTVINDTKTQEMEVNASEPVVIDAIDETDTEIEFFSNVTRNVTFTVSAITNKSELDKLNNSVFGETALGKIVDIDVSGLNLSNETEIRNVTIKMYYTRADLDLDGDGTVESGELDENNLFIYWYNSSNGNWTKLLKDNPDWVIDSGKVKITNNNPGNVWVKVRHLSRFGLMAAVVPQQSNASSNGDGAGNGGGGVGGVGVSSFEPFDNILKAERYEKNLIANMPVSYTFLEPEHSIYEILVTAKENENYIMMRSEVLKGTSKLVKAEPPGIIYINENIWFGTKMLKESLIKFKVKNSWLASNNLISEDIIMVKWNDNEWAHLETIENGRDMNYTYFESQTYSFSSFAIIGFKEDTITIPEVTIIRSEPTSGIIITEKEPEVKPLLNWSLILGVMFVISLVVFFYLMKIWTSG